MITAAQCRSARALLNWSVAKLAASAGVSESAIDDFELERRRSDTATTGAIQRAFEEVGVEFVADDDVRWRTVTTAH
jgi:transcriptional regulator with XRE-family HTH domain